MTSEHNKPYCGLRSASFKTCNTFSASLELVFLLLVQMIN